jgi:type IV pilus assembly protein PilV
MNRMRQSGFSLVEVLVALVIIGVGMLGIAKIQALAYASTGTAALRSLAAIEASSLASAMRANRDYWTVTAATATQTIVGSGQTLSSSTDGALLAASNCAGVICANAAAVAAYDVQSWMKSLNAVLPGDTATVVCSPPTVTGSPAGYPVGCTITISWYERNAAINAQSQGQTMAQPTYTLYVEP